MGGTLKTAEFGGIVDRTEIAVPGPERMAHHRDWVLLRKMLRPHFDACSNAEKLHSSLLAVSSASVSYSLRSLTEPSFTIPLYFTGQHWLHVEADQRHPRVRELPRSDGAVGHTAGNWSQAFNQSVSLLRMQSHCIGDAVRAPELAASFPWG